MYTVWSVKNACFWNAKSFKMRSVCHKWVTIKLKLWGLMYEFSQQVDVWGHQVGVAEFRVSDLAEHSKYWVHTILYIIPICPPILPWLSRKRLFTLFPPIFVYFLLNFFVLYSRKGASRGFCKCHRSVLVIQFLLVSIKEEKL